VAEEIRAAQTSANQKADVRVLHLDLSNLSSVDACVKDVQNQNLPLHILVNNGGIYDLGGALFDNATDKCSWNSLALSMEKLLAIFFKLKQNRREQKTDQPRL